MNANTRKAIENIINQYQFSEAEKKFLEYSNNVATAPVNHSKVIATLVLAKQIALSGSEVAAASASSLESNKEYSKKMSYLTIAVFVVGVIQAAGIILQIFSILHYK